MDSISAKLGLMWFSNLVPKRLMDPNEWICEF